MSIHMERVFWMPSPPLAPDDGPIDLEHLDRMTLGDAELGHEVLAMFAGQAMKLMQQLGSIPANAAELAHTLKGSALAIGAHRVAETSEALITALREDTGVSEVLMVLGESVDEARLRIHGILNRS